MANLLLRTIMFSLFIFLLNSNSFLHACPQDIREFNDGQKNYQAGVNYRPNVSNSGSSITELASLIPGGNVNFPLQQPIAVEKKLFLYGGHQYEVDLYTFPEERDTSKAWDDFAKVAEEIDQSVFIDRPSKKNYAAQLLYSLVGVGAVSGICSLTLYYDNDFVHMPAAGSLASNLSIAYIVTTCGPSIIKQFADIADDFARLIFREEKFKRVKFRQSKTVNEYIPFQDAPVKTQDVYVTQDLTPRKSTAHLACLAAHSVTSALAAIIPIYTLNYIENEDGFDLYAKVVSVPLWLFFQNLFWKVGKERIDSRFIYYSHVKLTEQRQKTEILLNHFSIFKKLIANPAHENFVNNIFQVCTSLDLNQKASSFYASLLILKSATHFKEENFIEKNAFTDIMKLNNAIKETIEEELIDLEKGQASQTRSKEDKESKGKEIDHDDVGDFQLELKEINMTQRLKDCLSITEDIARRLKELEASRLPVAESLALYSNYKSDVAHSTGHSILENLKRWASIAISGTASIVKYAISEHAINFVFTNLNIDPEISLYVSKVLAAGVAIWRTDTEINAVERMANNICNLLTPPNGGFKLLRAPGLWLSMISSGLVALPFSLVGDKNTFLNEIPKEVEIALLAANFFCDWAVVSSCLTSQDIITPLIKIMPSKFRGWNSKVALLTEFVEVLEKFVSKSTAEVREQLYRYTQDSM